MKVKIYYDLKENVYMTEETLNWWFNDIAKERERIGKTFDWNSFKSTYGATITRYTPKETSYWYDREETPITESELHEYFDGWCRDDFSNFESFLNACMSVLDEIDNANE